VYVYIECQVSIVAILNLCACVGDAKRSGSYIFLVHNRGGCYFWFLWFLYKKESLYLKGQMNCLQAYDGEKVSEKGVSAAVIQK